MKQLTKEQINEIVAKATTRVSKDICTTLVENIDAYTKGMEEIEREDMKQYTLYLATMSSSIQMSISIIREVLYELLVD